MFNLTKAQAVAVGVMLGLGVAAPALSWRLSTPREPLDAAEGMSFHSISFGAVAGRIVVPEAVTMEELVVAPNHQMLAETVITVGEPRASAGPVAVRRCYTHQSETLASGAVLVCDVERSDSGQLGSVFAPLSKPKQLAPRDVPSPTGLVEPE